MSLTKEQVAKIAKLARLNLTEAQVIKFGNEMSAILNWVDMLKEVDTESVKEMTSVEDSHLRLREDHINDGNIRDEVLKNAPQSGYGCFIVPKVVE